MTTFGILGCVCFGWKWFQEIIFTQTHMFGCNGKFHFSENHFLLTNIYSFDPEIILHSYFQFKSFPERERERERERRESPDRRERERGRRESRRLTSGALVDRAPRWLRRSLDDRTDLASDLAFTARSHLLLRCMISIWPDLMNFFAGFCFFCEWVWNWSIIACLQLRKCVENWACKAFSVKMFEGTKHRN